MLFKWRILLFFTFFIFCNTHFIFAEELNDDSDIGNSDHTADRDLENKFDDSVNNLDEADDNQSLKNSTDIPGAPLEVLSATDLQRFSDESEPHAFQAEVARLLDLIINSLYTNKDVFIRELLSNAADALEKARVISMTNPDYLGDLPELEIRVEVDPDANTISIQDTGIGMTRRELIENLGTVARSGTSNFLEALAESGDINLIGQFGVGFYAAFLVADRVIVASKHNDEPDQHIWESTVNGTFTVGKDPRGNTLKRGTLITLHMKNDTSEYLDSNTLRYKMETYNQFIDFPIRMLYYYETLPDGTKTKPTWQLVNVNKPIWMRPKEEVTDEEYISLFQNIFRDLPIAWTHFVAEGDVEFRALLYIPTRPPTEQLNMYMSTHQKAIRLYSHRVLVADSSFDLLPRWLNFIKGFVDTEDLPLKVDRESFSQSKVLVAIRNKIIGKFLELLKKLAKKERDEFAEYKKTLADYEEKVQKDSSAVKPKITASDYLKVWLGYHRNLKIGCIEDEANRQRIAKILRFATTKFDKKELSSLEDYVSRMPESQKSIYYMTAEKYEQIRHSPYMKYYDQKGYEVLALVDSLDEPCLERVGTYEGKKIVSIDKANADSKSDDEDEKRLRKAMNKAFAPLTNKWRSILHRKVINVQISDKIIDDVAVIRVDDQIASAMNDRMARAQVFMKSTHSADLWRHRHLDLNPAHPLIKKMLLIAKNNEEDKKLKETAEAIYDIALVSGGFLIDEPKLIVSRLIEFQRHTLGISPDEAVSPYELSPEELAAAEESEKLSDSTDDDEVQMETEENDGNAWEDSENSLDDQVLAFLRELPSDVQNYYKSKFEYLDDDEKREILAAVTKQKANPFGTKMQGMPTQASPDIKDEL